jgi:hypothetical protein
MIDRHLGHRHLIKVSSADFALKAQGCEARNVERLVYFKGLLERFLLS